MEQRTLPNFFPEMTAKTIIEPLTTTREERGQAIADSYGNIQRFDERNYAVKSQAGNGYYSVTLTEIGWKCSCPDHTSRGVKCKHIWAVELSYSIREQVRKNVVLAPIIISECLYCHSTNIQKNGIRHNKSGDIQRFVCYECNKTFSINVGFEKMKHNPQAVTTAMQLYFSGESLRKTRDSLKLIGVEVSHQTIHEWIEKYMNLMKKYIDKLKPNVGSTWRADEVFVKFSGNMKYLFALMDDETRYWIAQEVADTKFMHDAQGCPCPGFLLWLFHSFCFSAFSFACNKTISSFLTCMYRYNKKIKKSSDLIRFMSRRPASSDLIWLNRARLLLGISMWVYPFCVISPACPVYLS